MKTKQKLTALTLGLSLALTLWWILGIGTASVARAPGPWYVALGGNDGGACTSGARCATINGAIGKASSGDTIFVAPGKYTDTGNDRRVL